jgi:hypothetical protein
MNCVQLIAVVLRHIDGCQAAIAGGKTLTVKVLTRKAGEPVVAYKFLGTGKCDAASRCVGGKQQSLNYYDCNDPTCSLSLSLETILF